MNKIREQIVRQCIDEEEVKEMLELLGCKMIRPKYVIPAIIKDRYGKIYTENSFIKSLFSDEDKKQIAFRKNYTPTESELKELARSKHASLIEKRLVLPSVWSYEPNEELFPEHSKVVHKILDF